MQMDVFAAISEQKGSSAGIVCILTIHGSGASVPAPGKTEPETRRENPAAVAAWAKLLSVAWRIRRLQRIFGNLGQHLQSVDVGLRDRLKAIYTKQ